MSLEILGVIFGAISLYLAYITFFKEHVGPNKEKKEYLINRFQFAKSECLRTIINLKTYSESNSHLDGEPLDSYVIMIDKIINDFLNNQNLSKIKNSKKWSLYHDLKNIEEIIYNVHAINLQMRFY